MQILCLNVIHIDSDTDHEVPAAPSPPMEIASAAPGASTSLAVTNPVDDLGLQTIYARKKAHRKTGFNVGWLKDFSWLEHRKEVMICTVCTRAKVQTTFSPEGSTNFRRDKLVKHERSGRHKAAVERAPTLSQTAEDVLQPIISVKKQDLFVSLQATFFLLKENIAFAKYNPLLDLFTKLGAISSKESLPNNANLRGEMLKSELIATLGNIVKDDIIRELQSAPSYALIIDETMDIRTKE